MEEEATINAIKKAQPAVVSVVIKKTVSALNADRNRNFFFIDPFTGRPLKPSTPNDDITDQDPIEREVGGGTGFIISTDGYIITNKHVVSDKSASYAIFLNDGTEYKAQLLDTDPLNDLAVLKIEGSNLPTVELGDSNKIEIGQTVVAIGNSLNEYRQTVSKGIVSGLNRTIKASDESGRRSESLEGIIQTDAAINPGNSGGPLVNLQGQVIGINTAIDRSGQSIGFALPINDAKFIVESIKTSGRVVRPQLGVRYMILNKTIAKANQLPVEYGALIIRGDQATELAVLPGSPADKAGLVENDIILELNGQKIDEKNNLAKSLQKFKPGDNVNLKVYHRGEEKMYTVTLNEQSQQN
ncbi:MAG: trypsin-like peptidase domain-containing protein [Candidatus Abawacabacteria bacterium]|nr:trypsin-like peptidase domain-containing protein [Candidatus Abawacabacteria bacterium]